MWSIYPILMASVTVMMLMSATPSMSKVYEPVNIMAKSLDDDTAEDFYSAMDPNNTDFCMSTACVGPGMLVNTIMQVCNQTIQSISPSTPPTIEGVKKLISKCICGTTGSESGSVGLRSAILASWFTCQNCYREFYRMNVLNQTMFNKACDCVEPGPIDALMAYSRPGEEFVCKKTRRGGRDRVPIPPPVQAPGPVGPAAPGQPLPKTNSAPVTRV
ncbi:hypothetical protein HDU67_004251 [Dinochytrium kinnereticum]|nr:hypothetical protein HDU67_004251 [Dinochytrium kinnereticum]